MWLRYANESRQGDENRNVTHLRESNGISPAFEVARDYA